MPALGLGVFQTPPEEMEDAVRSALGAGYRHIDTPRRPYGRRTSKKRTS